MCPCVCTRVLQDVDVAPALCTLFRPSLRNPRVLFPRGHAPTRLQEVNFSNRNLTDKDVHCLWNRSCAKLTSINLSHNKLTTVPDEVANLRSLKSLDVSENELVALSPRVQFLTTLATQSIHQTQNNIIHTRVKTLCTNTAPQPVLRTLMRTQETRTGTHFGIHTRKSMFDGTFTPHTLAHTARVFIEIPQQGTQFTLVVDDDPVPWLQTATVGHSGTGYKGEWLDLEAGATQFHDSDLAFAGIPSNMRGMKYFRGPSNPDPMIIELKTSGNVIILASRRQVEVRGIRNGFVVYDITELKPGTQKSESFNKARQNQRELVSNYLPGMISRGKTSSALVDFQKWACQGLLARTRVRILTTYSLVQTHAQKKFEILSIQTGKNVC